MIRVKYFHNSKILFLFILITRVKMLDDNIEEDIFFTRNF